MANFKTHFLVGAATGAVANLVKQASQKALDPGREFSWYELLAWSAAGGAIASIPDLLEPATSPNHRGFFHSIAFGALAIFALKGKHLDRIDSEVKELLGLAAYSYLSHLFLDATTPKGLPII